MARRLLGPASLAVVRSLEEALSEAALSGAALSDTAVDARPRPLLVACSGGPDSLALAAATAQVSRRRGGRSVSAVVVDHGLQAGSAETATRAHDQLVGLGFDDVLVSRVSVDLSSGRGPEAAARQSRYALLDAEATRRDATVLLGHTLDDQAESVLLGLARGSGTRSLAGMAVRSGRYLRPLLTLRRATTEQACAELGLEPWHDPHNADGAYARSRVRSKVLPLLEAELGPGVAEALARTAQLARDDADLLDSLAADAEPTGDTLDCAHLGDLPAALRRRVIRRWLLASGAPEVTFQHVLRVEELVTRWHGQSAANLPGVRVSRVAGRLVRS
jgi:tRNA(Ile)-lysidine synthase